MQWGRLLSFRRKETSQFSANAVLASCVGSCQRCVHQCVPNAKVRYLVEINVKWPTCVVQQVVHQQSDLCHFLSILIVSIKQQTEQGCHHGATLGESEPSCTNANRITPARPTEHGRRGPPFTTFDPEPACRILGRGMAPG